MNWANPFVQGPICLRDPQGGEGGGDAVGEPVVRIDVGGGSVSSEEDVPDRQRRRDV